MAEKTYTSSVKKHLAALLNDYWLEDPLSAVAEHYIRSRGVRSLIDVAILDDNSPDSLIAIELEVYSNPNQIITNRKRFKEWVTASGYRAGGLLHIIFSEANISQNRMYRLLTDSYAAISEGKDFYYEFMAVEPDYRASRETARYLVKDSWEFDARLFALTQTVFQL